MVMLRPFAPDEALLLLPILHAADEDDSRILRALQNPHISSYGAFVQEKLVGAIVVHWQLEESEIEYLAVASEQRGRGLGKAIVQIILQEAMQRNVTAVVVGTGNTSLENIAFDQKCGFRIDSVRKDFFSYIQPPISENGIVLRDMLMMRYIVEK